MHIRCFSFVNNNKQSNCLLDLKLLSIFKKKTINLLKMAQWCWWHRDHVGDSKLMTIVRSWWQILETKCYFENMKILVTNQRCHHAHGSVTNIWQLSLTLSHQHDHDVTSITAPFLTDLWFFFSWSNELRAWRRALRADVPGIVFSLQPAFLIYYRHVYREVLKY